ncbi:NADPH:quinone oxidoreductase family protein [Oricola cellulosilytica]|uniref:NADPH:quinone oxidoreductase family protein n=1 Tax=Oricola cellulosilytica TaxID=1429082 RepID=A0A4R0PJ88_9HYPH|nr:NADPH:quinone oxidoreductase family protein [Oricola cellulosilytica]TCD16674.1 NADPH:quinone oxidoreductase family protein [Oricola cellulosilytica]
MRAIVAREFGPLDRLEYCEVPDPKAVGRGIVVEQEAIGINYPDGLLVQGLYQMKPPLPFVPGMEVVGRVVSASPDAKRFKPGDRVAAISMLGGYAEKVLIDERQAMPLPDSMPASHATALLTGYGTAHYALKQRAVLAEGETLCVLGASGLTGFAAVQIGKAMGARVIAVASTPEKRKSATKAGADEAIGYDNLSEELKARTGGKGVDVAFDTVGGEAFSALARRMAWNGRLLVIGFASGDIPKLPVNLTLVKNYSVVGVFWGEFIRREPEAYAANVRELFDWYAAGKIEPLIGGEHPLSSAGDALKQILSRGASGKHVLIAQGGQTNE